MLAVYHMALFNSTPAPLITATYYRHKHVHATNILKVHPSA